MQHSRKTKSGLRGVTRLYAVQTLYRMQFDDLSLEKLLLEARRDAEVVLSEEQSLKEIDFEFFENLLRQTISELSRIDQLIESHISESWKFDRLDKVMQAILRLGVCEVVFFKDIPINVIFNEYVEIAKAFFKKGDVSFANGLLNSVAKIYRTEQVSAE